MLNRAGKADDIQDAELEALYQAHLHQVQQMLHGRADIPVLYVSYNELLFNPQPGLLRLNGTAPGTYTATFTVATGVLSVPAATMAQLDPRGYRYDVQVWRGAVVQTIERGGFVLLESRNTSGPGAGDAPSALSKVARRPSFSASIFATFVFSRILS